MRHKLTPHSASAPPLHIPEIIVGHVARVLVERSKREQGNSTQNPAEMEMGAARVLVRVFRWWVLIWNNGMKPQARKTGRVNRQILPSPVRLINVSRKSEPEVQWGKHTTLRMPNNKGLSSPGIPTPNEKCAPVETEAATAPRAPPATAEAPPATALRRSSATK